MKDFVGWLLELDDSGEYGSGNIVNVASGHPAHADPSGLEEVEVLLLLQEDAHLLREPDVAEHSDLGGDVAPVSRSLQLLQLLPQRRPHLYDPGEHGDDGLPPLLVQLWAGEDGGHNPGSVGGRITVHGPDEEVELTLDPLHVGRVAAHHSQVTSSLVVETKVLAEALRTEQFQALRDEISDGPSIGVQTARGKTLVGAVKEWEEFLLFTNISDL